MLTKFEQDKAEAVCLCLPMIAESLASIAKSLETLRCNATPKDPYKEFLSELKPKCNYRGMGPGSDDVQ